MRYTLLSLLCSPLLLAAQPVVQFAQVDLIGRSYAVHGITSGGSSDPTVNGADVTWDFNSATLAMNAGSTAFFAPANTPYSASYPTSDVAQVFTSPEGTVYNYMSLGSAALEVLADGVGGDAPTIYTNPKTVLAFPLSYGETFTDTYEVDGITHDVSRTYAGYGTVILSVGTFTNVVKIASSTGVTDFYLTNPMQPLLHLENGFNIVMQAGPVGMAENEAPVALQAFPSPATDVVTVRGVGTGGTWQVLDVQGRVHATGNVLANDLQIPVAHLAAGTYMVQVRNGDTLRQVTVQKQ